MGLERHDSENGVITSQYTIFTMMFSDVLIIQQTKTVGPLIIIFHQITTEYKTEILISKNLTLGQ